MDSVTTRRDPPTVLLAENCAAGNDLLQKFFAGAGWRYEVVNEGTAALNAALSCEFDVIITDRDLPGPNCEELLRKLLDAKPTQAVIVITGDISAADAVQLLKEGARDFLQKPVDFHTLEKCVKQVLCGVQEQERHKTLYSALCSESCKYEFTTAEISDNRVPLVVAEQLFLAEKIDQTTKLRLELAFQEALTNSLEHGNLELISEWKEEMTKDGLDRYSITKRARLADPYFAQRRIIISTRYEMHALSITILDQGKGFNHAEKAFKKYGDLELPCFGRGRAIISQIMDEVSYTADGREITMVLKLEAN